MLNLRPALTLLTLAAAALPMVAGCPEVPMPTSLAQMPRCPVTLGAEDVITVRVVGEEDMSGDYQADSEGTLDFPYIGRLDIQGQTNTSLAKQITTRLVEGDLILAPQVSVVIKEHNSARINVDGQVSRPGSLPFRTGMTLLEAISKAGGRTPIADRRTLRLTRNTGEGTSSNEVPVQAIYDGREDDIELCPGDAVWVPQSVM